MPPCRKCSTGGLSAQSGDPGFAVLPDLILMDGGIGQVTSAEKKVLKAMGVQIPVLGMAKDDSHRTRALVNGRGTSSTCRRSCTVSILRKDSGGSSQVCDKYHRNLRGKNSIGSALDNIQGIGPAKRNAPAGSLRFHRRDKESFRRRAYRGARHHTAKRRSDKGILCQSDASLDEVSGFICASRAHFSFR